MEPEDFYKIPEQKEVDASGRFKEVSKSVLFNLGNRRQEFYSLAERGYSRKIFETLEGIESKLEGIHSEDPSELEAEYMLGYIRSLKEKIKSRVHEYALKEDERELPYRLIRKEARLLLSGEPDVEVLEDFVRRAKTTLYGSKTVDLIGDFIFGRPDDIETDASGRPRSLYKQLLLGLEHSLKSLKAIKGMPLPEAPGIVSGDVISNTYWTNFNYGKLHHTVKSGSKEGKIELSVKNDLFGGELPYAIRRIAELSDQYVEEI